VNKRGEISVQLKKQEIKKNIILMAKFFLGFKFPIAMLLTDSMDILLKWLVVISYRTVTIVGMLTRHSHTLQNKMKRMKRTAAITE